MDKEGQKNGYEIFLPRRSNRKKVQRAHDDWRDIGIFEVMEQRLADQTRVIRTNG